METFAWTALSLGSVAIGAVLAYLMFTTAARRMGPEEFGHFATWLQSLTFLAVLATLGQETLILRSWNECMHAGRPGLAMTALRRGYLIVVGGSLAVSLAIFAVGTLFLHASPALLLAAGIYVTGFALMAYSYGACRIIAGMFVSVMNAEITPRLFLLVFLLVAPFLAVPVTTTSVLAVFGTGMLLLVVTQGIAIFMAIPTPVRHSATEAVDPGWRARGTRMWLTSLLDAFVQNLDVVLLGVLIDPVLAGGYFAASRLANLMAKVTDGINVYASRRIAHLYFGRSLDQLRVVLRSLAMVTALLVFSGAAALLAFGEPLLTLFGETYAQQLPTLIILILGTGCAALGGPARFLLLQTGHEAVCLKTIFCVLAVRVVLLIALASSFGAMGAAIAWTSTEIASVIALNIACRSLVGADPSILSLFRKMRRESDANLS